MVSSQSRIISCAGGQGAPPTTPVGFTLSETPTFMLLSRASSSVPADSEEGSEAQLDNDRFQQYHGDVHTFNDAEIQTVVVWVKSRGTNLPRVRLKNAAVQATTWDIFDTEHGVGRKLTTWIVLQ